MTNFLFSAGVGATGTIILSDICCRMAFKEDHVDALKYLQKIRDQRPNLVDNAVSFTKSNKSSVIN